jgi:hypothetical protein
VTALLVPIALDALAVRPAAAAQTWARTAWTAPTRPAAGQKPTRQDLAPPPFADQAAQRPAGIHLHWAVPDGLSVQEAGASSFPALPCRWLVVRLDGLPAAGQTRRVSTWMIPNIHTDAPTVVPGGHTGTQPIGTATQPVTIRGRGDDGPHPSWALDYDDTLGRLAFHDPLTDPGVSGPLAYLVVGWYTHTRLDPLTPPAGTPVTPTWLLSVLDRRRWTATLPAGAAPPTASIYHGAAVGIGWPDPRWPGDDSGRLSAELDGRPSTAALRLALGDTLPAALAALLDDQADPEAAAVTEALLAGDAVELSQPDGASRLDASRHQARFHGVSTSRYSRDVIYAEDQGAPAAAVLPQAVTAAVAAAVPNAVAGHLSALTAAVAAAARPTGPEATGGAATGSPVAGGPSSTALAAGSGAASAAAGAAATAAGGGAAGAAAGAAGSPGQPAGTISDVAYPLPRRWQPADPVAVLAGLGRTFRHGGDGRFNPDGLLDCRVSGQTVTAGGPAVLPAWSAASDVPAEVGALVGELAALDPGSVAGLAAAGPTSAAAAARAAWWDTWAADWRTAPAGAGWQGVLPSPVGVTRPTRPWNALRLDWEVAHTPTPAGPSHWPLGELDFDPADPFVLPATATTRQGIGWLSAAPADLLRAAAERPATPGGAGNPGAGADLADLDVTAAALEGFVDRVRGTPPGVWVSSRGIDDTPSADTLKNEQYDPTVLAAGVWRLARARAVDTFGQVLTVYDPAGAGPVAADPAVPAELLVPDAPGVALRPRFTAPAVLEARYLDPRGDSEVGPGRNPVCGFVLPSPFDATMEVCDAEGTSLARLRTDPRTHRTVLEDTPGTGGGPLTGALAVIAGSLAGADRLRSPAGPADSALGTLLRLIDTTRSAVDVTGRAGDGQLALLLGHPVAVVRLGLTATVDDPQADRATGAPPTATPCRVGSIGNLQDGVLAWFVEDRPEQVHPVHAAVPDLAVPLAADPAGSAPLAGPFVGDPLVWLRPGQTRVLVLLVAPGADITVVSGLLPQKRLEMPREWTERPLRKLTPTLGFDALLRDPAALSVPVPGGIHGVWSWFTRRQAGQPWTAEDVSADPPSAQPGQPVAVQDGYLRVTLIDEPAYQGVPVRVTGTRRWGPANTIQALCGPNPDGTSWQMPIDTAVEMVESGRFWLFVRAVVGGAERDVGLVVAVSPAGRKYLHTDPDETTINNLDTLPPCP